MNDLPMNVNENVMLYDTVGIYMDETTDYKNPPGWFQSYAALGAAPEINFFSVRNRADGLPWCNMDSRDKLSTGFRASSLGISFFANSMTTAPGWYTDATFSPEDIHGHIWMVDIPRHAGFRLRVQQDDVLVGHVMMAPPGYGPCGDGYGRGSPSTNPNSTNNNGYDHYLSATTQGIPAYTSRWPFPKPLEIPRDSTINLKITFSEWARRLLAAMIGPRGEIEGVNDGVDDIVFNHTLCGIQVSLEGERLVQPRGQWHR